MSVTRPSTFFEADPVADLIGWVIGKLHPGDHVGDRVLGGEADDQPEHGGRGEDAGGQAASSSVNWLRTIATTTRKTISANSRRRIRSLVLVERETW